MYYLLTLCKYVSLCILNVCVRDRSVAAYVSKKQYQEGRRNGTCVSLSIDRYDSELFSDFMYVDANCNDVLFFSRINE